MLWRALPVIWGVLICCGVAGAHINTIYWVERDWQVSAETGNVEIEHGVMDPEDLELAASELLEIHDSKLHFALISEDLNFIIHTHPEWGPDAAALSSNTTEALAVRIVLTETPPAGWYYLSYDFTLTPTTKLLASFLVSLFDENMNAKLTGAELQEFRRCAGDIVPVASTVGTVATADLKLLLSGNATAEAVLWYRYAEAVLHGGFSTRVYFPENPMFPVIPKPSPGKPMKKLAPRDAEEFTPWARQTVEKLIRFEGGSPGIPKQRYAMYKAVSILGEGCATGPDIPPSNCSVFKRSLETPKYRAVVQLEPVRHCTYTSIDADGGWPLDDPRYIPAGKRVGRFPQGATVGTLRVYSASDVQEASPLLLAPLLGAFAHVYVVPWGVEEYPSVGHVHAFSPVASPFFANHSESDCSEILRTSSRVPSQAGGPPDAFAAASFYLNGSAAFRDASVVIQFKLHGTSEVLTATVDAIRQEPPEGSQVEATPTPTVLPAPPRVAGETGNVGSGDVYLPWLPPMHTLKDEGEACCGSSGGEDVWMYLGTSEVVVKAGDGEGGQRRLQRACTCVKLSRERGIASNKSICQREGGFQAIFPQEVEGSDLHLVQRSLAGGYVMGVHGGGDTFRLDAYAAYVGVRSKPVGAPVWSPEFDMPWGSGVDPRHILPGFRTFFKPGCGIMGHTDHGLIYPFMEKWCERLRFAHLCMRRNVTFSELPPESPPPEATAAPGQPGPAEPQQDVVTQFGVVVLLLAALVLLVSAEAIRRRASGSGSHTSGYAMHTCDDGGFELRSNASGGGDGGDEAHPDAGLQDMPPPEPAVEIPHACANPESVCLDEGQFVQSAVLSGGWGEELGSVQGSVFDSVSMDGGVVPEAPVGVTNAAGVGIDAGEGKATVESGCGGAWVQSGESLDFGDIPVATVCSSGEF